MIYIFSLLALCFVNYHLMTIFYNIIQYLFLILILLAIQSIHYLILNRFLKFNITKNISSSIISSNISSPIKFSAFFDGSNYTVTNLNINGHDCYFAYLNSTSNKTFCLPNIIVAGFRKAGTSALFKLFSTHQDSLYVPKEICFNKTQISDPYMQSLEYFGQKIVNGEMKKFFISGCLFVEKIILEINTFKPINQKYILLVRNLPDYLWASYNFWCIRGFDIGCRPGGFWNQMLNPSPYKSPELFHELVILNIKNLSHIKLPNSNILIHGFKKHILKYLEYMRSDQLLILPSENISTYESWNRISKFTKMNTHQNWVNFSMVRLNANENPGVDSVSSVHKKMSGRYRFSNFRPLMNTTRELLNNFFEDDCKWLKKFNITYDCV